jgi:hypothetical protein
MGLLASTGAFGLGAGRWRALGGEGTVPQSNIDLLSTNF